MIIVSNRARSVAHAVSLFAAYSSAAAALAFSASPAGADALPHLTLSHVATMNAGGHPVDAPAALAEPLVVDWPQIAYEMRAYGTTTLRVDLSSEGSLVATSVMTSTRNWWLDHAALDAIRQARFQPETRDGRRVAGSYLVDVVFPESDS